jgi:hypothetical protein
MLWSQNFKKYNLLCWDEGDFCLGGEGGLVVCKWGELGLGRRRRNRGEEGRERGHTLTFSDGFTDGIIRRCVRRLFWRKNWHVTVRICYFESLGNSVSILNGESVTSPYRAVVLNPSVKITLKNLHVSEPFFFLILNFSSVIQSVTTDRQSSVIQSVTTDEHCP